jgi:uridine kinase
VRRRPHPILVAIAGGSGSGKTWLANRLAEALEPHVSRISLDDFYRDLSHLRPRARERVNFDHPRAIDWSCLERALKNLMKGSRASLPQYDFETHCRRPVWKSWRPRSIVVCEGLWPLRRPAVRKLFHLRVFLECPAALRLRRRLERDVRQRGRKPALVLQQFRKHVTPMHRRFVAPQARHANVVLRSPLSGASLRRLAEVLRELMENAKLREAFGF